MPDDTPDPVSRPSDPDLDAAEDTDSEPDDRCPRCGSLFEERLVSGADVGGAIRWFRVCWNGHRYEDDPPQ